jgi:MerR family transcriptional regulator, Zn(II)-responsive regulator of zntA
MRIGELAKRVGLTTETLRFYERQGLLGDMVQGRSEGNYRVYSEAAVERLETIQAAKQLGFSLAEILELSRLWESGKLDRKARIKVMEKKLAELETKRAALERLDAVVRQKLHAL